VNSREGGNLKDNKCKNNYKMKFNVLKKPNKDKKMKRKGNNYNGKKII
jgi:hypothetical protein